MMETRNLPVAPTPGTYRDVWAALKNNTQKTIVVRCPPGHMETLIQAIKKIKSIENSARKSLEDPLQAPHYGRLKVKIDKEKQLVQFSLTYAVGDLV